MSLKQKLDEFSEKYKLSKRERDVLNQLICGNASAAEAANELGLSSSTIRIYIKNLNRKIGCVSKTHILSQFIRTFYQSA